MKKLYLFFLSNVLIIGVSAQSITPCENGMAGFYPCQNVDLITTLELADMGGGFVCNDLWGWTDDLDGKEYALVGRSNGTSFLDITDPFDPIFIGNLPGYNGSESLWRDIKVFNNYAFIVSEAGGHGMQVFDLTRLRDVGSPPETFTEDAHYDGFGNAHNIVINEASGFAYGVGTNTYSGGPHFVNINDPLNPAGAGGFSDDGYTHDAQVVIYNGPDAEHVGKEFYFGCNENSLTVVDVTDKTDPQIISRSTYDNSQYAHQGWLTEDHKYFFLDDELDEMNLGNNTRTFIWDIQDVDEPVLIGDYFSSTTAIDHNMYVRENFLYQSNYTSGLRILDITDVANSNLTEVAYFDVWPLNDDPSFTGSWSNYPFFESGNVIVSSMSFGLFIVKPNLSVGLEPIVTSEFQVYPIPTSDELNITCSGNDQITSMQIIDVLGNIISSEEEGSFKSQMKIDVSFLNPGIYLLRFNDNTASTVKFIVK